MPRWVLFNWSWSTAILCQRHCFSVTQQHALWIAGDYFENCLRLILRCLYLITTVFYDKLWLHTCWSVLRFHVGLDMNLHCLGFTAICYNLLCKVTNVYAFLRSYKRFRWSCKIKTPSVIMLSMFHCNLSTDRHTGIGWMQEKLNLSKRMLYGLKHTRTKRQVLQSSLSSGTRGSPLATSSLIICGTCNNLVETQNLSGSACPEPSARFCKLWNLC